MKLGIGLYRNKLTRENYRFARQCGCTHIVAHLANYYVDAIVPTTNATENYGRTDHDDEIWTYEHFLKLREEIESEGLKLHAIENFSPAHWYDVLLDGPKKREQIEHLKQIVRDAGRAGIPVFGYNFTIAGVWGHTQLPRARGGASTACFDCPDGGAESPIPNGEVWNMTYDDNPPEGFLKPTSPEELWARAKWFLDEMLPVAEEAGVRLAAHPDDPPMPALRGHARLVHQPRLFQRLVDLHPSPSNCFDFCMGSVQEMQEGDIYEVIERYAPQGKFAYIHFRNVRGKVPNYQETFVDDGDIDMLRALQLLKDCGYDGVLVPDHTPQMTCAAPWHCGMAYALGFMRAALRAIDAEEA
ncbi:MAG: TIM barrel protein [Clostridiales bacterium]|nr:TIM barrel protein [Clostridiales bacterium]